MSRRHRKQDASYTISYGWEGAKSPVIAGRCFLIEFEVEFTVTPGDPGQYSGDPENCYPASPPEAEIVKTTVKSVEILGDNWRINFDKKVNRNISHKTQQYWADAFEQGPGMDDDFQEMMLQHAGEQEEDAQSAADDAQYEDWKENRDLRY